MPDYNMRINPGTNQPLVDQSTSRITEKLQSREAMKAVNRDVVGFVPLGSGSVSHGGLAAYHIANFLTLGLVGSAGAMVANSSVMGSQKGADGKPRELSAWQSTLRTFGQTHLNATLGATGNKADRGIVNRMATAWGHIPSLTGLGAAARFIGHRGQKARKAEAFQKAFQEHIGKAPTQALTKSLGTGDLVHNATGAHRRQLLLKVAPYAAKTFGGELAPMDPLSTAAKPTPPLDLTARDCLKSDNANFRALFVSHVANTGANSRELQIYDWADKLADKVPGSGKPQDRLRDLPADKPLGKHEVMAGYSALIKDNDDIGSLRNDFDALVAHQPPGGDGSLADFRERWNGATQQLKALQRSLASSTSFFGKRSIKGQIKSTVDALERMKTEPLDPASSKRAGALIANAMDHSERALNGDAQRFGHEIRGVMRDSSMPATRVIKTEVTSTIIDPKDL